MINVLRYNAITRLDQFELFHGEVLFVPNSPITSLFLVEKGSILIFSSFGRYVLRSMSSGQLIGLEDLLSLGWWSGLGVAHGPTRLRSFCAAQLQTSLAQSPASHQALLRELALS